RPVRRGEGGEPDEGDEDGDEDDEADAGEEAARQIAARLPRLLREVRDRLEARVGEERERHREGKGVPRRLRAEVEAAAERARREEEGEAEHDEEELRDEVEQRHREAERVELRPRDEARDRDQADRDTADDHVPRVARDRVDAEREPEVVGEEQRGEGYHDQVVEEERPAGEEAREVVERHAHERRGAARLPDHRRPLRVRGRDDEEEQPDDREDDGRQAERVERDDPEREIERGGDLAVRDGRERRRVEHPLQPRQLARHRPASVVPLPAAQQIEAADAEPHEQDAEEESHRAAAAHRGLDEERDAEADRHEAEDGGRALVEAHAARSLAVATMTRQGACRRTKSTASPKIWRRPRCSRTRRGPAMRIASSTIARPMFRVLAIRPVTRTPYESPIARASSSCSFASRSSSGDSVSRGSSSGTWIAVKATIEARRSAARRQAKSIASSEG